MLPDIASAHESLMMLGFLENREETPVFSCDAESCHESVREMFDGSEGRRITKDDIPVGSVEFTQHILKNLHGIDKIHPIQIPGPLMSFRFLKRQAAYSKGKDLAEAFRTLSADAGQERLFIKDVSGIKIEDSGLPDLLGMKETQALSLEFPERTFFLSGYLEFTSEWRAFLYRNEIRSIRCCLGEGFAPPEKKFILDVIASWDGIPDACTVDIGMSRNGPAVIECHDFVSCGLYGFEDPCIPHMLRAGWKRCLLRQ